MAKNDRPSRDYTFMRCRVTRLTYEFYECELRAAIDGGTPEDVCRAARGLVRQCFTRRSVREWMIDTAPEWMLLGASSTYRALTPRRDVAPSSNPPLLKEVSPKWASVFESGRAMHPGNAEVRLVHLRVRLRWAGGRDSSGRQEQRTTWTMQPSDS
jgi:hypothetical protein